MYYFVRVVQIMNAGQADSFEFFIKNTREIQTENL